MRIRFPKPITQADLDDAYAKGMIAKKDLKHGMYYEGHCRNASVAKWDDHNRVFRYVRTKFTSRFVEVINHPENDDGYDLFIPMKLQDPQQPDPLLEQDFAHGLY